jgi:hypothetical protein
VVIVVLRLIVRFSYQYNIIAGNSNSVVVGFMYTKGESVCVVSLLSPMYCDMI